MATCDFGCWTGIVRALSAEFARQGIDSWLKLVGPDNENSWDDTPSAQALDRTSGLDTDNPLGGDSWVTATLQAIPHLIGAYDSHRYATIWGIENGVYEDQMRARREQISNLVSPAMRYFGGEVGMVAESISPFSALDVPRAAQSWLRSLIRARADCRRICGQPASLPGIRLRLRWGTWRSRESTPGWRERARGISTTRCITEATTAATTSSSGASGTRSVARMAIPRATYDYVLGTTRGRCSRAAFPPAVSRSSSPTLACLDCRRSSQDPGRWRLPPVARRRQRFGYSAVDHAFRAVGRRPADSSSLQLLRGLSPSDASGLPVPAKVLQDVVLSAGVAIHLPSRGIVVLSSLGSGTSTRLNDATRTVLDDLGNWHKVAFRSGRWRLDHSVPAYFNDDRSRATPHANGAGYLVYRAGEISSFELKAYCFGRGGIGVYGSEDGKPWTPISLALTHPAPALGSGGWYLTVILPRQRCPLARTGSSSISPTTAPATRTLPGVIRAG